MAENPYTPPSAEVKDPPRERLLAAAPRQIRVAVGILIATLVLALPIVLFDYHRSSDEFGSGLLIGFMVVFFGLGALLIYLIARGYNFARIAYLVLTILSAAILWSTWQQLTGYGSLELVLNGVSTLLEFVALYLLFTRPGSLWFRELEPPRAPLS